MSLLQCQLFHNTKQTNPITLHFKHSSDRWPMIIYWDIFPHEWNWVWPQKGLNTYYKLSGHVYLDPSRAGLAKNEPNTNVPVMKVWGSVNNHHIFKSYSSEELSRDCAHLQDEDKVVRRSVADIEVMFLRFLALLIELQLLDYIRVLQQPQQNLLGHLIQAKCFHFCKGAKHTFVRNVDTNITRTDIQQYTGHTPNCHMYFQCFQTEYIPKVFEILCHYQEFGFWFEVHKQCSVKHGK